MTVTCQCGRPAHDGHACHTCTARLRSDLAAVPSLAGELDTTLTRQTAGTPRNGGRSADAPLPYDLPASEAAWILRNTLGGWARVISEEALAGAETRLETINGLSGHPSSRETITTAQIAVWLAEHVDQLRQHPAAGEAIDEIREAITNGWKAVDRHSPDRQYVGPCTDDNCRTELYAKPGATNTACRGCGQTYDVDTRRQDMREQLNDHLGTASYVATIATGLGVRVAASTVRMWAQRRYLEKRGTDDNPLYRVGDVITVAQATTEERRRART